MDHINVDLSGLGGLSEATVRSRGFALPNTPNLSSYGEVRRNILEELLKKAAKYNNSAKLLLELFNMAKHPPLLHVTPPVPVAGVTPIPVASKSLFTAGLGLSVTAAAVATITGGGGFYASNVPQFGVYVTVGGGVTTNTSFGGAIPFTFIFGGPSDFAGTSWGFGADIGIWVGGKVGLNPMLIFSTSPFKLIGFSIAVTLGLSALPVDFTAQYSGTTITKF